MLLQKPMGRRFVFLPVLSFACSQALGAHEHIAAMTRGSFRSLVGIFAILSVAICLVPAGARLFEISNMLSLPATEYMAVQKIYAGSAFIGIAIYAALLSTLSYALLHRYHGDEFGFSLPAFLLLGITQAIFWIYTYPMNLLTRNWLVVPDKFSMVQSQWEFSHAVVNAVLTFAALICIVIAATHKHHFEQEVEGKR